MLFHYVGSVYAQCCCDGMERCGDPGSEEMERGGSGWKRDRKSEGKLAERLSTSLLGMQYDVDPVLLVEYAGSSLPLRRRWLRVWGAAAPPCPTSMAVCAMLAPS